MATHKIDTVSAVGAELYSPEIKAWREFCTTKQDKGLLVWWRDTLFDPYSQTFATDYWTFQAAFENGDEKAKRMYEEFMLWRLTC